MLGLKDFCKTHKGYSFLFKMKQLYWQIKYAWQRAWNGYDNTDIFELNNNFIQKMLPIMKDFRKHNVGLFYDTDNCKPLNKEETNEIINKMVYLLENSDENAWLDLDIPYDYDKMNEMEDKARENQKEFLNMFVKWFDQLWY